MDTRHNLRSRLYLGGSHGSGVKAHVAHNSPQYSRTNRPAYFLRKDRRREAKPRGTAPELPIAIVGSIGKHCPKERNGGGIGDFCEAVEDIDQHEIGARKEEHTEKEPRQDRTDDIEITTAIACDEGFGKRNGNNKSNRTQDIE